MIHYNYDTSTRCYRSTLTGRFVATAEVMKALSVVAAAVGCLLGRMQAFAEMAGLASQVANGRRVAHILAAHPDGNVRYHHTKGEARHAGRVKAWGFQTSRTKGSKYAKPELTVTRPNASAPLTSGQPKPGGGISSIQEYLDDT